MVVGSPTKLNLIPAGVMPVVYINQGDAGYDKEFLVYNGDSPYNVPAGVSATIRGKKADGYGVTEAAALTTGSNLVTITVTEQMVAAEGANLYELVFVDTDGLRIATINMVWAVKKDALGDAVISDSDLDYASQVLDQLQSVQAFKYQLDTNTTNIESNADDLAAETAARIAADNTLQLNITAEANTRSVQDNSLQAQINQLVAPSGSAPSAVEVENARIGANGFTYSTLGEAIRTQIDNANDRSDDIAENYTILDPYFYKKDTWINASFAEATIAGWNLYKVPIGILDVVQIKWHTADKFWYNFNVSYALRVEKSDGTYRGLTTNAEATFSEAEKEVIYINPGDGVNLVILCYNNYVPYVTVHKNAPTIQVKSKEIQGLKYVTSLSEDTAIKSVMYMSSNQGIITPWPASSGYISYFMRVKSGDRISWNAPLTGVSYGGVYKKTDGSYVVLPKTDYTFTEEALVSIIDNPSITGGVMFYPADSIMIEGKYVVGDVAANNPFNGFSGVAFGTSLTYRAQTTGGYLQYLPALCGMTFDNQGLGGSYILGNMLPVIKAYTGYSDKRVCLFEGFTNDWYYNHTLGTYEDTTETTVCGCVRSAINYMLSQNANLTIFLILDHYGRDYNDVDSSSDAVNSGGYTQLEYYGEIAKVAESLGIPVIKLYAMSQMSENTPQYYIDNIHPSALGAKQTANAIWSQMRQYFPNEVSA